MESSRAQGVLDRLAIAASSLCVLHCLATPVLLILIPALASTAMGDRFFHGMLLAFTLPSSSVALLLGCRRHKDWIVFALGLLGLVQLLFSAFVGHDLFGEAGERFVTILGGVTLAIGHLRNYRLCRADGCES